MISPKHITNREIISKTLDRLKFTLLMHIRPTACFFRHNSLNSFEAHDPTVISRILLTLDFIDIQHGV